MIRDDMLKTLSKHFKGSLDIGVERNYSNRTFSFHVSFNIPDCENIDQFIENLETKLSKLPIVKKLINDAIRMDNFKRDI